MKELLKIKQEKKKKNPVFTRQDNHKKSGLARGWRRPKGLQSKMRLEFKGYKRSVKPGYGTPAALRHTDDKGRKIVLVSSAKDVASLSKEHDVVILASSLGMRSREGILKDLKTKGIDVHFGSIASAESTLAQKLAKKKARQERIASTQKKDAKDAKSPSKKEKTKQQKEDADAEQDMTAEEKKQNEKKELDKMLIHTS